MDDNLFNNTSDLCLIGDNYIITKKRIGKGTFASIYKGYNKITKEEVAIKKIEVNNVFKLEKNIKREIEIHKSINHENIVKLYDVIFDTENHNIYLVMELCELGDFTKYQQKRPMSEYHIQKYIKQLANGLKYMIDRDISHRDLKPQNILLTKDKLLKISDFGLAKKFSSNIGFGKQTYCGSPLYMSPEILHYQNYNEKSDLWSVGIIIYEMITGTQPYHVKNYHQLMKKIKSDIDMNNKFIERMSYDLQDLLKKLLVKDPKKRIGWSSFFNHPWILLNLEVDTENMLLDFSIVGSLPSISNLQSKHNEYLNKINDVFVSDNKCLKSTEKKKIDMDNLLNLSFKLKSQYPNNDNDEFKESEDIFDGDLFLSACEEDDSDNCNNSSIMSIVGNVTNKNDNSSNINDDINSKNDINDNNSINTDNGDVNSNDVISIKRKNDINSINSINSISDSYEIIPKTLPINIPNLKNNTKYNVNDKSIIDKESKEYIEDRFNKISMKHSTRLKKKNITSSLNNDSGYFKNMIKGSLYILSESFDYLSSNNKSL